MGPQFLWLSTTLLIKISTFPLSMLISIFISNRFCWLLLSFFFTGLDQIITWRIPKAKVYQVITDFLLSKGNIFTSLLRFQSWVKLQNLQMNIIPVIWYSWSKIFFSVANWVFSCKSDIKLWKYYIFVSLSLP